MTDAIEIATYTFRSPINKGGSWGQRNLSRDTESVMRLYRNGEGKDACWMIEWEVPALDRVEYIGIWFEPGSKMVVDYDGVMDWPKQASDLLRSAGFTVDPEIEDVD